MATLNTDSIPQTASDSLCQDNFFTPNNHTFYSTIQYNNLDPTKQEIRLLELLPVEDDETIQIRIVTGFVLSSEDTRPYYCAISYHAGNHADTTLIKVNGVDFNAFSNLARALRQVIEAQKDALKKYPHLIWADQICINQSNKSERSHQVGFMRDIFHHATIVLACVGEYGRHPRWSEVSSIWYEFLNNEATPGYSLPFFTRLDGTKIYVAHRLFGDLADNAFRVDCRMLDDILSSPWWARAWICQEIIVARKVIMIFGSGIENLDNRFAKLIRLAHNVEGAFIKTLAVDPYSLVKDGSVYRALPNGAYTSNANFIVNSRAKWKKDGRLDLKFLLDNSGNCQVSDARDKVFAFIGLGDPDYRIIPDYNEDVAANYRQACKRIILHERSLDVIVYGREEGRRADLPTWTPDWSQETEKGLWLDTTDKDRFNASTDYYSAPSFHANTLGIPDTVLRTQCLIVDRVAYENTIGTPEAHWKDISQITVLRNWTRITSADSSPDQLLSPSDERYFDGETMSDAFVMTMLQGLSREGLEDVPHPSNGPSQWNRRRYYSSVYVEGMAKVFFRSPKGYIGLVDERGVQSTDYIVILLGLNVPCVLRKVGSYYVYIDMAYVHGLARGEAVEMMQRGELIVETIDIH